MPPPVGRMDPHPRGARADPVDEREGMQPGQRGRRGVLRQAQERVPSRAGLEGRGLRRVPQTPWTGRLTVQKTSAPPTLVFSLLIVSNFIDIVMQKERDNIIIARHQSG